jgi:hypothetical protein
VNPRDIGATKVLSRLKPIGWLARSRNLLLIL